MFTRGAELGIKELFTYSMFIDEEVERGWEWDTVKTLGLRRDHLGFMMRGFWFAS